MSRAIFAKVMSDGKFISGLQMENAIFRPSELKKRFDTEEKVDALITLGE